MSSAPPAAQGTSRDRLMADLNVFSTMVAVIVLLGAPAGLVWSRVAPRLTVTVTDQGGDAPDLLSSKAFIGADASYLLIMVAMGVACGLLAWRFVRRSGPFAVGGLVVGGLLAALVAAEVGLRPGSDEALEALSETSGFRGEVELYLGRKDAEDELSLRAPWAAVGWPVGACVTFLALAFRRPEELD